MRISFSTLIAVFAAFGLFFWAVLSGTDNYMIFVSGQSMILVLGGTLASTFISYEPRYVILSLKLIWKILKSQKIGRNVLKNEVGRIIKWSYAVQKNGIPALEAESQKAIKNDPFLKFGVEMVLSGYTGEEVEKILSNTINTTYSRNTIQVDILKNMGSAAPAFGMIGTLVGLIIMLDGMGGDPSQLGKGLAIALNTTLYGVIFSRMVFLPASAKVLQREQIIRFRNSLLIEGLSLLAERKSPRYIQDKMNSYIDPSLHFDIDKLRKK